MYQGSSGQETKDEILPLTFELSWSLWVGLEKEGQRTSYSTMG